MGDFCDDKVMDELAQHDPHFWSKITDAVLLYLVLSCMAKLTPQRQRCVAGYVILTSYSRVGVE